MTIGVQQQLFHALHHTYFEKLKGIINSRLAVILYRREGMVGKMTVGAKVKQTLAGLNGIKRTLEVYVLQTQDEETVSVYKEAVNETAAIIDDLEKRLRMLEFEEPQYKGL